MTLPQAYLPSARGMGQNCPGTRYLLDFGENGYFIKFPSHCEIEFYSLDISAAAGK